MRRKPSREGSGQGDVIRNALLSDGACMEFTLGCSLSYTVEQPTPFVFNLEIASLDRQRVLSEKLTLTPPLEPERWTMPESGNRYFRVIAPPGEFGVRYEAAVELDPLLEDPAAVNGVGAGRLPLSVLTHLYPSRYCQSDRLDRFAHRTFGHAGSGHQQVNAICNWICENVDYESGSSDEQTSAVDTFAQRVGVCRDFTHLAIALCRALGIPARYVSAYAWRLEPPDFHAVMEAFLCGPSGPGWYLFDPTRKSAAQGLVRIGVGRDAAEVAFCSPFGEAEFGKPQVRIDGGANGAPNTIQAVRLQK